MLDLPPDAARDDIRRAYARKLKVTHPEDDPEGFKLLREAYEHALAEAEYRATWAAYEAQADDADEASETDAPADGDVWSELEAEAPDTGGHDWRAAPPLPAAPDDAPEIAALLAARDADLEQLRGLMGELESGLRGPWRASDAELEQRLHAILGSDALGEIRIRDDIEIWLAELIVDTVPASDAILQQAIEAFGWGENGAVRHHAIAGALERLDEWRIIASLNHHGHDCHAGWRSLTAPPGNALLWRLDAFRPDVRRGAAALLGAFGEVSPGLHHSFNAASVERWEAFFAKSRLTLGILLQVPALFAAICWGAFAVSGREPPLVLIGLAAILACVAPFVTMLVLAPWRGRLRDRARDRHDHDGWRAQAWLPTYGAALVLAGLLPGSWPTALALPALGIAIWAFLARSAGPPDAAKAGAATVVGALAAFATLALVDVLSPAQGFALAVAATLFAYLRVYHRRDVRIIAGIRLGENREAWLLFLVVSIVMLGIAIAVLRSSWAPATPFYPVALCILAVTLPVSVMDAGRGPPRWIAVTILVLAFLGAGIASLPPPAPQGPVIPGGVPLAAGGATDASGDDILFDAGTARRGMAAMEQAQPGFAQLRDGDPVLYAALRAELEKFYDGQATREEAAKAFAARIDTVYRTRLPDTDGGLLMEGQRIRLSMLRALRKVDVAACADEGVKPYDPALLTPAQRARQNAQLYNVIIAPSVPLHLQGDAEPVSRDALLIATAHALSASPAETTERLAGKQGAAARCDARIAMLGVLVEMPQESVVAMLRKEFVQEAGSRD